MAILAVLGLLMISLTGTVSSVWRSSSSKIESFRDSRNAFESITRRLNQATLNTYWDYDNPAAPTRYGRQSELRFLSGPAQTIIPSSERPPGAVTHSAFFQVPEGISTAAASTRKLQTLLNTWGFYISRQDDANFRPNVLDGSTVALKTRFRLMEMVEPSDMLSIYTHTSGKDLNDVPKNNTYVGKEWFTTSLEKARQSEVLAENVIALVLRPQLADEDSSANDPLAPDYLYDSTQTDTNPAINPKNQLPPLVDVTMVAIDEASAARLETLGDPVAILDLDNLFSKVVDYETDMNTLEGTLKSNNLNYRIFQTRVAIPAAKWSIE